MSRRVRPEVIALLPQVFGLGPRGSSVRNTADKRRWVYDDAAPTELAAEPAVVGDPIGANPTVLFISQLTGLAGRFRKEV